MEENFGQKIAEDLEFVEYSNFIRRSTESDVRWCRGIDSEENTCGRILDGKLARLKPVTLLQ